MPGIKTCAQTTMSHGLTFAGARITTADRNHEPCREGILLPK